MVYRPAFTLFILLLILIILVPPGSAKDTNTPVPDYEVQMAEFFYPDNAVSHIYHADIQPHWIRNDAFWYADPGRDTTMFFLVNVSQGVKKRFIDTDRFVPALGKVTGKTIDPAHLPLTETELAPDEEKFSFAAFGEEWSCDLTNYHFTKETLPAEVQAGVQSPDQAFIAYVNGSNLWLYDTRTGTKSPLTTEGTDDYFYGKRSDTVRYPVSESRLNESPVAFLAWSPDSSRLQTFRVDQRTVNPLWLVQDAPGTGERPVLFSYRFACPGDEHVPMYEPVTIDVRTGEIVQMQFRPQPEVSMMDTDQDVLQWWSSSGNVTWSLYLERGEKTLRLLSGDPVTGEVKEVMNETGSSYIESNLQYTGIPNIVVLEKSGDIIWFSERDGWGHLYRYDSEGRLKNQVTSGEWVVRDIVAVDEENDLIYFTASGKEEGNPYYQYLYRIHPDGTGLELLTPEEADHVISFSPDMTCFIDSYSRVDLPTVTVLKSVEGTLLMQLATADEFDLRRTGWTPPERVTFSARDGKTDLYGLLFKPTDFDEKKTYPVIDVVYPGPYTIVTATSYPADLSWNSKIFWTCQMLSELGYIVVTMDGLGTAYRSKAFHNVSYGHLSDCGLPDHISGLEQMAGRYPFMNISQVGMYGKSAGGFMTAQAMLTYPEFFKVGVAASGDHDSRLYGSFWGEKYEGLPDGDSYLEQATPLKAGNLTGDLLIMTGDMDDNVHPAMSMQLADALQKEGKMYDMFIFTNKNHELNYDPYYLRKMMGYFVERL